MPLTRLSELETLLRSLPADSPDRPALEGEQRRLRLAEVRSVLQSGGRTESGDGAVPHPRRSPEQTPGASLTRDQSMLDAAIRSGDVRTDEPTLSLGKLVRGLSLGDWKGAGDEARAVSESPSSAGGVLLPAPVSLAVIDKARAEAQVFRAGARTVPVPGVSVKYPRLLTEPTPQWRLENAAINDQSLTFDSITLTPQSAAIMVKVSWELLEDSSNIDDVVASSFAKVVALEIDRVALRGSGTLPEPRGLRNTSGISVVAHGANGSLVSALGYGFLLDAATAVMTAGYTPTAVLTTPRTELGLAKLVDTTGQYLTPPASLAGIPRLATTQIPITLTTGTSTDTTETYIGEWPQLVVGLRHGMRVRFLAERFADAGQSAFMCDFRLDVGVLQPGAFVVDVGIRS